MNASVETTRKAAACLCERSLHFRRPAAHMAATPAQGNLAAGGWGRGASTGGARAARADDDGRAPRRAGGQVRKTSGADMTNN